MPSMYGSILTLMNDGITESIPAAHIARVEQFISAAGFDIASFEAPSEYLSEIKLTGEADNPSTLQAELNQLSETLGLNLIWQTFEQRHTNYRLICFDMDSTLIQNEVMDEIAIVAGIGEHISAITESAMRGEITFQQSFQQRLALLEGFSTDQLPHIAASLCLSPGAKKLISTLRQRGFKIALFSGGFTYFAEGLQAELGPLDYIHANQLEIVDQRLTGKIIGDLVDEKKKAQLIQSIAAELNIRLAQTIAVGDGANDIPMLQLAGMGVAYHAKPVVKTSAQYVIDHGGLDLILPLLGVEEAAT